MADVILVAEDGSPTGTAEIVAAHSGAGLLHKAFSIYVFRNRQEEILIQRRSKKKMLWPGIWANTCCSHPRNGESPVAAGTRRLQEELGFTTALRESGSFIYRAEDPHGRGVEHEHVTILLGETEHPTIHANPEEVMEWQWISVDALRADMQRHPEQYAPWFHLGLTRIFQAAHV